MRAAVLAFALLPGVGPTDPRVGADPRSMPWAAVARLQVPGISRCTAVMVAPHWAATAAHCLGVRRLGHVVPASAIHLLFGYADGTFTRHLVADAVQVDPAAAAAPEQQRGADLALLHVGTAGPALPLVAARLPPGTPLMLGGYGQDRAERLAIDPDCRLRGQVEDRAGRPLLVHDCAGTRGTSGGAVLALVDGQWRLAGLQVAGSAEEAGGVAVPASTIGAMLARLPAAAARPGP